MNNAEIIKKYISNPNPLWNESVAELLINYKWDNSLKKIFRSRDSYSISGCVFKDENYIEDSCFLPGTNNKVHVVFPSYLLSDFYVKHGLKPANIDNSFSEKIQKVSSAMNLLRVIKSLHTLILQLVKSIQIIESENCEIDTSYSNPDIPFSIFFSICNDSSVISNLRIAESILHETMHLLLSLVENHTHLVKSYSQATFYSPWRNEQRPIRGVLHGMFVFRAIKDFYSLLLFNEMIESEQDKEYIRIRVKEIGDEMLQLNSFSKIDGLTELGRLLSCNLVA